MSTLVAILGLGFLILIHEAGHFFTARLVGMSPRRFYLGFPPALVKWERKGIEYGLGSIPLGGYVKIPGMHRPAPSDVDVYFARAISERPQLFPVTAALRRRLEEGDMEGAKPEVDALQRELAAALVSPGARRAADRGIQELRDGLGGDAYWRQRAWKKIAVIFAGPGTNLLLAIALFTILFMIGGGRATATVDDVLPSHPAAQAGLRPGDRIIEINGAPAAAGQIRDRIAASHGKPLVLVVVRDRRLKRIGPVRPKIEAGAYRLGFVLRGAGLGFPTAAWEAVKLTGRATGRIVTSLGSLVHRQGRKQISSPVGIVQGSSNAL
ncbi:MAG: hypothetical protein E6G42_06655, partial [Actinobacteria bacterium]